MAIKVSKAYSPDSVHIQLGSIKDALKMKQWYIGKALWIPFLIFHPYKPFGTTRTCQVFGLGSWTDGSLF